MNMQGIGGPLLCIGDLLNDVGDDKGIDDGPHHEDADSVTFSSSSSPTSSPTAAFFHDPTELHQLFEDNYSKLIKSLEGNDHSWTALTLKLCAALKTANKLVTSANSNIESLLDKVETLESILKRGESAVHSAKTVLYTDNKGVL